MVQHPRAENPQWNIILFSITSQSRKIIITGDVTIQKTTGHTIFLMGRKLIRIEDKMISTYIRDFLVYFLFEKKTKKFLNLITTVIFFSIYFFLNYFILFLIF